MFRKLLPAVLILALLIGFSSLTKADVTGNFDIHINLTPDNTKFEAVTFNIDFQSNLNVNITTSGLTIGADLGFGTPGIEFAIVSLDTNLGALHLHDEFIFASPFGCANFPAKGTCAPAMTVPIGDGDGDGVIDNAVGFVAKRVYIDINIAGISISNLAIFEDVDFPDIEVSDDHEADHFMVGANSADSEYYDEYTYTDYVEELDDEDEPVRYDLSTTDVYVDNNVPTFGFGDVITIKGQTVSGVTVIGSTYLCASNRLYIKKRNWDTEVNKTCTAAFGMTEPEITPEEEYDEEYDNEFEGNPEYDPEYEEEMEDQTPEFPVIEGGAKTPLLFEKETLKILGLEFAGMLFDVEANFIPLEPLTAKLATSFQVFRVVDVDVEFTLADVTRLNISGLEANIVSDYLDITLIDNEGDLKFDSSEITFSSILNVRYNPAEFMLTLNTDHYGLKSVKGTLGINYGYFTFDTYTKFGNPVDGELHWEETSFNFGFNSQNHLAMGFEILYAAEGLQEANILLGFGF